VARNETKYWSLDRGECLIVSILACEDRRRAPAGRSHGFLLSPISSLESDGLGDEVQATPGIMNDIKGRTQGGCSGKESKRGSGSQSVARHRRTKNFWIPHSPSRPCSRSPASKIWGPWCDYKLGLYCFGAHLLIE